MNSAAVKDIVAGTSAGLVSVVVCHPLDTIRVRLQTAPVGRFTGVGDVIGQTFRHEGVTGFYKGIASPMMAQALQKATMFYSFGMARRYFVSLNTGADGIIKPLPLPQLFVCGSIAGISNSLVASPFELVRNRLQVQYQRDRALSQYKGPIDCVRQIIAQSGVRSLWLGVVPMMIRDAPGVGAWFATNEGMRRLLIPPGQSPAQTPYWKILLAGATAGVGFWVCAFPQDTIKNVIQTRGMNMTVTAATVSGQHQPIKPSGFFATGGELIKKEGFGRLWKGFPIAAARGIPGAASTFLTYQLVINYLNEHNYF